MDNAGIKAAAALLKTWHKKRPEDSPLVTLVDTIRGYCDGGNGQKYVTLSNEIRMLATDFRKSIPVDDDNAYLVVETHLNEIKRGNRPTFIPIYLKWLHQKCPSDVEAILSSCRDSKSIVREAPQYMDLKRIAIDPKFQELIYTLKLNRSACKKLTLIIREISRGISGRRDLYNSIKPFLLAFDIHIHDDALGDKFIKDHLANIDKGRSTRAVGAFFAWLIYNYSDESDIIYRHIDRERIPLFHY